MGFFARAFLRGLATVLPVVATVYILWWSLSGAEDLMKALLPRAPIDPARPDEPRDILYYFPGLGIAVGIVALVGVGVLLNHWLVRWFHDLGVSLFVRLPFVKTIYRMLKDMVSFFAQTGEDAGAHQVVMVRPVEGGPEMLGFVTRTAWDDMPAGFGGPDKVGVYLPMSYQIGGFLIVVDKTAVRPIDMEMEDALRIALAAGISSRKDG